MAMQYQAQEVQEEKIDDLLQDAYDSLIQAADESYDAVAEDVERFFGSVIDQGGGLLDHGRIDTAVRDGKAISRHRGVQYVGDPADDNSRTHRYVPLSGDWDEHLQDVYAPFSVAASYIEQLASNEISSAEQYAVSEVSSYMEHAEPDASTAQFVFDTLQPHIQDNENEILSRRIVYNGS